MIQNKRTSDGTRIIDICCAHQGQIFFFHAACRLCAQTGCCLFIQGEHNQAAHRLIQPVDNAQIRYRC